MPRRRAEAPPVDDPAVAGFMAKYEPALVAQLEAARATLQALVPCGCELVYDNYNALVFAYGPNEHASQAVLSIAAYPRWLTLFFAHGTALDDPQRRLGGSGVRVRQVRLASPATLDEPAVRALIAQALAREAAAFAAAPALRTVVRSVSAKQRPRRPTA